ncbi:hypothetical protein M0R72_04500 [Candidatus Pacearchaeota archaeon]|nr:hypothetical protein [Candidatus Pacearchaeota archaeon]
MNGIEEKLTNTDKNISEKKIYTLEINHCDGNPEADYWSDYIVYKNGAKYFPIDSKSIGDYVVKALNFFEKNENDFIK